MENKTSFIIKNKLIKIMMFIACPFRWCYNSCMKIIYSVECPKCNEIIIPDIYTKQVGSAYSSRFFNIKDCPHCKQNISTSEIPFSDWYI